MGDDITAAVTESVAEVLSVGERRLGELTGAVIVGDEITATVTEAVAEVHESFVEAERGGVAAAALAAWWRAARWLLRSLSLGPRWRGRQGGGGGKEGAGTGGREWGAPGWPRLQLNSTVALPPLVVRFRVASPPKAQNCMNSPTDAPRNWEFDLDMLLAGRITL